MKDLSEDVKETIAKRIHDKGVTLPCPRCGSTAFQLLDGYLNFTIQNVPNVISLGGKSIPVATIICLKCGNMSFHALGTLGLLEQYKKGGK